MRVSETLLQAVLIALLALGVIIIAGQVKAASQSTLYKDISILYPKLDINKNDPETNAEIIKLILFEMDQRFEYQNVLAAIYTQRDYTPIWLSKGKINQKAEYVLDTLKDSWTHGLNPKQYHVDFTEKALNTFEEGDSALHRQIFELSLTNALIKYALDMTSIRVEPEKVQIDSSHWRDPVDPQAFLNQIAESADFKADIESLIPNNALYQELRLALIRQVTAGQEEESLSTVLRFSSDAVISPDTHHKAIPYIRQVISSRYGHAQADSVNTYYDSHLAKLVHEYQKTHNIIADGIIGPQTLNLLKRDRYHKINQIIANLERLRWVEFSGNAAKPDKYIAVNIPSSSLWAVENDQIKLQMPVVVGRKERPTKSFVAQIKGVRINPEWTIPDSIKVQDFYPKIAKDPHVLSAKNISVYDGYGPDAPELDPLSLNWSDMGAEDLKRFNMVQRSGADNPLGQIRFLMYNEYDIYLHDTNQPELFKNAYRAESSGCIRVSQAQKLADFVMAGQESWLDEMAGMRRALDTQTDIKRDEPLPVYILYLSVWFQRDGELVYGPDVYEHDSNLIKNLRHNDAIFTPEDYYEVISALKITRQKG